MKEIIKVGNLRNESQSGIVLSRGGTANRVFRAVERPIQDNTES